MLNLTWNANGDGAHFKIKPASNPGPTSTAPRGEDVRRVLGDQKEAVTITVSQAFTKGDASKK